MAYRTGARPATRWTVEQRYRLKMGYAESPDVTIASSLVSSEAKNGLRYRFDQKETRNGADEEENRRDSQARRRGQGRRRRIRQALGQEDQAAPAVLFPTAHTAVLIDKASAGEKFVSKQIFDGGDGGRPGAGLGRDRRQGRARSRARQEEPAADRPGWRVRLAFFPAGPEGRKAGLRDRHGAARQRRLARHGHRLRRLRDPRQARRYRSRCRSRAADQRRRMPTACDTVPVSGSSNSVGRSASAASTNASAPTPIRRNRVTPSTSPASRCRAVANSASASCVGRRAGASGCAAGNRRS